MDLFLLELHHKTSLLYLIPEAQICGFPRQRVPGQILHAVSSHENL